LSGDWVVGASLWPSIAELSAGLPGLPRASNAQGYLVTFRHSTLTLFLFRPQLLLVVRDHPILRLHDVLQGCQVQIEKILTFEVLLRLCCFFFLITIKFIFNHVCLEDA